MARQSLRWLTAAVALASTIVGLPSGHAAAQSAKKRLLLFTHVMAARHDSLPVVEQAMLELAQQSGDFEVTALGGYKLRPEDVDLSFFTGEYLQPYDGIMFMTSGELPLTAAQKQLLLAFVSGGKGFVGVHSAAATFYEWTDYGEMLGGYYQIAGRNDKIQILKVEDPTHPATKMLGDWWPLAEEFYSFGTEVWDLNRPEGNRNSFGTPILFPFSRDRVHVLLSIDTARSDLTHQRGKAKGGDHPVSWCRAYGEGRVFYTGPGHRAGVWSELVYREHVLGGVRWALGLEPGDCSRPTPR